MLKRDPVLHDSPLHPPQLCKFLSGHSWSWFLLAWISLIIDSFYVATFHAYQEICFVVCSGQISHATGFFRHTWLFLALEPLDFAKAYKFVYKKNIIIICLWACFCCHLNSGHNVMPYCHIIKINQEQSNNNLYNTIGEIKVPWKDC